MVRMIILKGDPESFREKGAVLTFFIQNISSQNKVTIIPLLLFNEERIYRNFKIQGRIKNEKILKILTRKF